jgi:hypothetical protein
MPFLHSLSRSFPYAAPPRRSLADHSRDAGGTVCRLDAGPKFGSLPILSYNLARVAVTEVTAGLRTALP